MRINAKVLWFDKRDGYGVATDEGGNEYYIDISAIQHRELLREGQTIAGEPKVYSEYCCGLIDVVKVTE